MQSVDFTTLSASCHEIGKQWIPARLEQVYQLNRFTLVLGLRTLEKRGWLTLSWHPQAARICLGSPPPRHPDTFTFSEQLRHQLKGFALTQIAFTAPWERVIDLQFAHRPNEPAKWHLYLEVMGKYSNAILTTAQQQIISVAHQVTSAQSMIRTVETGQPYQLPPALTTTEPSLEESFNQWQERIRLIPDLLKRQLWKNYRGVSPVLAQGLIEAADIDPTQKTDSLTDKDWRRLFQCWQQWLKILETGDFCPTWTKNGYSVVGWDGSTPVSSVQVLLQTYYDNQLNQAEFQQLRQKLGQKITNILKKLYQKQEDFQSRLQESKEAETIRLQADLLMAYLQEIKPGMSSITLPDFNTGNPVQIPLNPEKNAVQNAQQVYKRHQKLKRSHAAIAPLLQATEAEIDYLQRVEASLEQLEFFNSPEDLIALKEIQTELMTQGYLSLKNYAAKAVVDHASLPRQYSSPSGLTVWVGRNNRQNDQLTFRTATDRDLWFHAQEIAGSHVLLRLSTGEKADQEDLQFAADLAALFSRARQSETVPVIYTQAKYLYKPKGAKPGTVVYKQEQLLWGKPERVKGCQPKK